MCNFPQHNLYFASFVWSCQIEQEWHICLCHYNRRILNSKFKFKHSEFVIFNLDCSINQVVQDIWVTRSVTANTAQLKLIAIHGITCQNMDNMDSFPSVWPQERYKIEYANTAQYTQLSTRSSYSGARDPTAHLCWQRTMPRFARRNYLYANHESKCCKFLSVSMWLIQIFICSS